MREKLTNCLKLRVRAHDDISPLKHKKIFCLGRTEPKLILVVNICDVNTCFKFGKRSVHGFRVGWYQWLQWSSWQLSHVKDIPTLLYAQWIQFSVFRPGKVDALNNFAKRALAKRTHNLICSQQRQLTPISATILQAPPNTHHNNVYELNNPPLNNIITADSISSCLCAHILIKLQVELDSWMPSSLREWK